MKRKYTFGPILILILDWGKSQDRRIELTESNFRDEVTRRDDTVGLTKLVDRFATRTERQGDEQTLLSELIKRRWLVEAMCHPYGIYMAPMWHG